ncbi:unnamed protein product, partial [Didymodactylos carnosus]
SDICNLLQFYLNKKKSDVELATTDSKQDVNQITWSILRRTVKTLLDTSWCIGYQVMILRHASLEQKLQHSLLKNEDEVRSLHALMAEFYQTKHSVKHFASLRIPYHLQQAHRFEQLVQYLRSPMSRPVGKIDRQMYLK